MLSTDFILNIERGSMARVWVKGEKILKLKELLIRNEDNDIFFDECKRKKRLKRRGGRK